MLFEENTSHFSSSRQIPVLQPKLHHIIHALCVLRDSMKTFPPTRPISIISVWADHVAVLCATRYAVKTFPPNPFLLSRQIPVLQPKLHHIIHALCTQTLSALVHHIISRRRRVVPRLGLRSRLLRHSRGRGGARCGAASSLAGSLASLACLSRIKRLRERALY